MPRLPTLFQIAKSIYCGTQRRAMAALYERFKNPKAEQGDVFTEIVGLLSQTAYGQSFGARADWSYEEYSQNVPLVSFEEMRPWIDRQVAGEAAVVTPDPVLYFEPTSGSSGAAKMIPFTERMRQSFSKMFTYWLQDILTNGPAFRTGKLFYSVSPNLKEKQQTASGVPIGLEDDSEYLSGWLAPIMRHFSAIPPEINGIRDPEDFRRFMVVHLLATPDLEMIYIWSPSFLQILLRFIEENRADIISCLEAREIRVAGKAYALKRVPTRTIASLKQDVIPWREVWPELKLISCWASSHAKLCADALAKDFPGVLVQPKGLLATESPLTTPFMGAQAPVPLIDEVFFEFIDDEGVVHPLWSIRQGGEYEIVVSQKGGLYRYRLGDRVRVEGFVEKTPCLEFIGRSGMVVDMVGEKLNEAFVTDVLASIARESKGFYVLCPVVSECSEPPRYHLVTNTDAPIERITGEVEKQLSRAHHYDLARKLGQLAPLTCSHTSEAQEAYFSYFQSKGMKWGDIKDKGLMTDMTDARRFLNSLNPISTQPVEKEESHEPDKSSA